MCFRVFSRERISSKFLEICFDLVLVIQSYIHKLTPVSRFVLLYWF